ncbi:MAG: FAD-binding oxidoreductase [Geminicoccaceae bacterium]
MAEALLAELRAALGDGAVAAGADVPERNRSDWSQMPPVTPLAVVRPATPVEVATAMRLAHRHRVPVVPQGGLTGLAGGARPVAGGLALSLERLVGIEEIDADAATMTVLAGTTLETLQNAAAEAGFMIAIDLGARGSCAVGGNLATNAGGNRVIRYGMAREMVLGLEVVLPDGTLVTGLHKMLKNNAGYDLKQLFLGSEGTLGVITRAVLRLWPLPQVTAAALCGLAGYPAVLRLLRNARRGLGPILSAFEVMWPDYWNMATGRIPGVRRPLAGAHDSYVLIEAQGSDDLDAQRFARWLEAQLEDGVLEDAAVAGSLREVREFWATRDAASEFRTVLGPHAAYDIGLPVAAMDDYARDCRLALDQALPGCASYFYGHIADGNLHILSLVPGAAPQPMAEMDEVVYALVRRYGGTISAEHGIGTKKKPYLPYSRSEPELALMRRLKAALDPDGLLNPGKVV